MVKIKVKCIWCGSEDVVRHGKNTAGMQVYVCRNKDCEKSRFQLEYKNKGCNPKSRGYICLCVLGSSVWRVKPFAFQNLYSCTKLLLACVSTSSFSGGLILPNIRFWNMTKIWLGHGDIGTTMNIYAHIEASSKKTMINGIENALRKV